MRELNAETSLGPECIDFAEETLGLALMPWQKWFLLHALELHPTEVDEYGDSVFRFRKVILLVGRQSGKSTLMQVMALWRLFIDRASLVLGTAQDLEVAETLWAEALDMALDVDELRDEIQPGGKIERQPGRKMFRLRSRETYKVKAATRRGGRGLSGDLVVLDELREHQTWDAWAAVTKTTNAKARAQIYGVSNAGDATSVVLRYLRKKAHEALGDPDGINVDDAPESLIDGDLAGDDENDLDSGLGIFEWSAPPNVSKWDREAWAASTPALGWRVGESTMLSDAHTDPEWVFRTECMCQWSDGSLVGPFPPGAWESGIDPDSEVDMASPIAFAVDSSTDRQKSYIALAGWRPDGIPHVEVVAARAGVAWVVQWLAERVDAYPTLLGVALQSKGAPASTLLDDLGEVEGLTVLGCSGPDLTNATGVLYDAVCLPDGAEPAKGVRHLPQPMLDVAAATAVTKLIAGGAAVWDRNKSVTDIAPLVAANLALWALNRKLEPPAVSAYEAHGVVTV